MINTMPGSATLNRQVEAEAIRQRAEKFKQPKERLMAVRRG
jgi:hypothetical protein